MNLRNQSPSMRSPDQGRWRTAAGFFRGLAIAPTGALLLMGPCSGGSLRSPPGYAPSARSGLKIRMAGFRCCSAPAERELIWNAHDFRFRILSSSRRADYDRFLDALAAANAQAGIKNTATAFGLLLDAAEKQLFYNS